MSEKKLKEYLSISDKIHFLSQEKFSLKKPTIADWVEVIAYKLTCIDVLDFHFSEMAKALAYLNPDDFMNLTGRNLAAVFARPDIDIFQHAGQRGHWMLRDLGDGYDDNRSAIQGFLEQSEIPLHFSVIYKNIKRNVNESTIYAILSRDSTFIGFGGGVFGIPGKFYDTDTTEERWMCSLLHYSPSILESRVYEAAKRDSIDLGRVHSIAAVSKKFRYVQGFDNPPNYQEFSYYSAKRLRRWLQSMSSVSLPDIDVLLEGTRQAFGKDDYTTILKIKAALEESRREIPEDFHDYFFVAENNV